MNLLLNPATAEGYKSSSQAARRITEEWATDNLHCIACPSDLALSLPANTPVQDYMCPKCGANHQLKIENGAFGQVVQNSAYEPKMAAIADGRVPHYAFLQYSRATRRVTDLSVVPAHFISPAVIQQRRPLSNKARRAGWVGSNILLGRIPLDAQVVMVGGGTVSAPDEVRDDWRRYAFLQADERSTGGWGADVLSCVRTIQQETGARDFTL